MDLYCDTDVSSSWWDADLISLSYPFRLSDTFAPAEQLQLDNLLDDSMQIPDPKSDSSSTCSYLPSPYTPDPDWASSVPTTPDIPSQVLDDYPFLPACVSPVAPSHTAVAAAASQSAYGVTEVQPRDGSPPTRRPVQNEKEVRRGRLSNRRASVGGKRYRSFQATSDGDGLATTPASPDGAGRKRSPMLRSFKTRRRSSLEKSASAGDAEQRRGTRSRHNLVEKKYREHLNRQFTLLLAVLPTAQTEDDDDTPPDESRALSKASVLELARLTVRNLEKQVRSLNEEVARLGAPTYITAGKTKFCADLG